MQICIALLKINAVLFLAFGVGFLSQTLFFAQFITDGVPVTTSALIDMRATYGGMSFGFGVFLAYCALSQRAVNEGIVASILVMFGLAFGRGVGILIDGAPNTMMYALLLAELLFGVLLMLALMKASRSDASCYG